MKLWKLLAAAALLTSGTTTRADAAETGYSPYAGRDYPTRVYWGDTHLHTTNSFDARIFGVTLDAEDSYRFARGEEVVATHGVSARLSRPLDFLVVTDHSDGMGLVNELVNGNPTLLEDPHLRDIHDRYQKGGESAQSAIDEIFRTMLTDQADPLKNPELIRTVWERHVETADRYNEPGRFTAVIGYEWTPTERGIKLHRNILYRGDATTARQLLPFTAEESVNPQDLWTWMQRYEDKTGGKVLALAHNGNLTNGEMFPVEINPATGEPLDADYVRTRRRWEVLYEVTQIKGDSEAHPYLSPDDEFADFETWDRGNVDLTVAKTPDMLQYEYARAALKNGLKLEQQLGANPYQFGMVGSTDSHTALSTAEESNFFGKLSPLEPSLGRVSAAMIVLEGRRIWENWESSASGYAGVWATENTREAIWDAMMRKEVYATSGPRMTVRFFGGWGFSEDQATLQTLAAKGYAGGVPMGGTLSEAPGKGAPKFLVAALKDPYSANLDRIQIVKGWLDKDGEPQEKIYNVVWGDAHRRKLNRKGKLDPVGSTVDVANASWTNSIGDAELVGFWQDADFDASQPAFYYVRVIEIPTPRWTAYDAKHFGVKLAPEVRTTLQERAYTSPIWYGPGTGN